MKLTPRQALFVEEYLKDLNATAAYIRAGYRARGNSAEVSAAKLLRLPKVAQHVEKAKADRTRRNNIDADRVLQELGRIAFFDIGKAFTPDGALKPLDEMDEDTRRALAGLEVVSLTSDGEHIGTLKKVKIADKLGALGKLAQHFGMLDPKITLKGDAQNPLLLLVKQIQGNSLMPVREGLYGGDEREDDNR
ncbi:terminase small subunit [Methylocystis parvus]|uniref:Terminase small subunit n=1 Tax=Methylocystis parvus TaxID=134 RepID=A0A6B8LZ58_9HYPH|nr:terminase small subunit [Methylocystis parvus]QGM97707.1 terminase small subunit [Methylocystis parvus]WBJ98358.1 terminase small subunit [Methylocystis parvus OBBP]